MTFGRQQTGQSSTYSWRDPAVRSMGTRISSPPQSPSVRHGIGQFNNHDACPFPMPSPPCCRVEGPQILRPPRLQMIGNRPFDLSHYSSPGDSDLTARLHEMSEVVQVQVVRPEV